MVVLTGADDIVYQGVAGDDVLKEIIRTQKRKTYRGTKGVLEGHTAVVLLSNGVALK